MADGDIIGKIERPGALSQITGDGQDAIYTLISRIFVVIGSVAGIYFVIQILLSGFAYISANGDPKKTEAAWAKIYQSIIGLLIVSSAFVIASVIGRLLGIDILNPSIEPALLPQG